VIVFVIQTVVVLVLVLSTSALVIVSNKVDIEEVGVTVEVISAGVDIDVDSASDDDVGSGVDVGVVDGVADTAVVVTVGILTASTDVLTSEEEVVVGAGSVLADETRVYVIPVTEVSVEVKSSEESGTEEVEEVVAALTIMVFVVEVIGGSALAVTVIILVLGTVTQTV